MGGGCGMSAGWEEETSSLRWKQDELVLCMTRGLYLRPTATGSGRISCTQK